MSDHDDHEIDDNDHDEDHDGSHVGRGKMTESEPLDGEPAMDDEFDDFAQEQEDAGDDDFGDFDDAFQEPDAEVAGDVTVGQARMTAQQPLATPSVVSSFSTSVNCSTSTLSNLAFVIYI